MTAEERAPAPEQACGARRRPRVPAPRAGDGFGTVMAGFPTGVGVMTAMATGDRPVGMACFALCCGGLEPFDPAAPTRRPSA
ncbi:flavin reductase family protein [Actinoalloteichus fjordicus]|uniref:flavin reductase family protein n=1 Tax=Actinoalloteichus fjordicus TaxID=1612552 RepID=UPI0012F7FD0A|nr:flavin reductase family protein [Actinoalloteichus fjordicus]